MLPIVVVVMVAAGDAADPVTVALVRTAKRALDPDATVLALETREPPSDAAALAMSRAQRADAVVVVRWEGERASLRVGASELWATRAVDFAPSDAREERGRTLGLVVASMVSAQTAPAPPPPPPPPTSPPTVVTPAPRKPAWLAMEIGPSLAVGLTAPSFSLGPQLLVSARAWSILWLHASAQARGGRERVRAEDADAIWFVAGGGAGVRAPVGPIWLGARAHLELVVVGVERAAGGSATRAMGAVTAMGELGWQPGIWGVRVGVGPETSLESTRLTLEGETVGRLPTSRVRFEAGLGVVF